MSIFIVLSLVFGWTIHTVETYYCDKLLLHYENAKEVIKTTSKPIPKLIKGITLAYCMYSIQYYKRIVTSQRRIMEIRKEIIKRT